MDKWWQQIWNSDPLSLTKSSGSLSQAVGGSVESIRRMLSLAPGWEEEGNKW
jgi:hypothetical protein